MLSISLSFVFVPAHLYLPLASVTAQPYHPYSHRCYLEHISASARVSSCSVVWMKWLWTYDEPRVPCNSGLRLKPSQGEDIQVHKRHSSSPSPSWNSCWSPQPLRWEPSRSQLVQSLWIPGLLQGAQQRRWRKK
jgi:hypothetical protein